MRAIILTAVATVALAAGVVRSQDAPKTPDMHMMTAQQHMAMQMSDKKLDDLIAQLNAAKGNDRIDKLVAVVNELAAERRQMRMMHMNMNHDASGRQK